MSDKSYRIKTKVGGEDNVISVNLKQGVKTLNILSLEINPEDAYDVQTSDYGVIVGRVLANNAFGVPNVKVSVFIPIEESDENDYIISNEYPFKTPQSKDNNGVKYNLIHQKKNGPGTFPSKNMLLDNNGTIEVYDKYWKYTAVTNESGDYMIFGVPTGTTQVHYDCDLSDIGMLSQHPYDLISKGYDANLFKSKVEFTNTDLASAVHIISQDMTLFVYPFWGDKNANKIGITRKDIDINYEFTPSCVFMGSSITDPVGSYIGIDGKPSGNNGKFDALSTSVGDIEIIRYTQDGRIEEVKDNVVGIIDGNGVWCYQIQMNLDRIGTDEYGNIVAINDPNRGIPTRARVRFRISLTDTRDSNTSSYTAKFLVPSSIPIKHDTSYTGSLDPVPNWEKIGNNGLRNSYEFGDKTPDWCFRDLYWGKVYSIKQYYPRFHFEYYPRDLQYYDKHVPELVTRPKTDLRPNTTLDHLSVAIEGLNCFDFRGYPTRFAFDSSCISSIDVVNGLNTFPYTTLYAGPEEHIDITCSWWFYYHFSDFSSDFNMTSRGLHFCFENDWINGCLYFPRVVIQRNGENDYDYFGRKKDENIKNTDNYITFGGNDKTNYTGLYISGRHNWHYNNGLFTTIKSEVPFFTSSTYGNIGSIYGELSNQAYKTGVYQENVSIFSRVNLFSGILTKKETMLGESVFYYRNGCYEASPRLGWKSTYKRLYETDIILLGNLEDIYDSLPKLYNNLPSTTAIFPPVSPPRKLSEAGMTKHGYGDQIMYAISGTYKASGRDLPYDSELVDIFKNTILNIFGNLIWEGSYDGYKEGEDEYGYALYDDTKRITINKYGEPGAFDLGPYHNMIANLLRRSSLFFGLKIHGVDDFLEYDVPTFVNTSRICELDVHNDSAFYGVGGSVEDGRAIIPINGMIDSYDISTNENRSSFATMNYDIERYVINPKTRYKQYVTTPLYITGFEGRLNKYATEYIEFNNEEDLADKSYIMFRFGLDDDSKKPYKQTRARFSEVSQIENVYGYCNGDLILPKDSFYFYFGLRTGFSAIDLLTEKFIGNRKEVQSDICGIKCNVDPSNFVCNDGYETGSVSITFAGMALPVDYELYYKNMPYKKGKCANENLTINGLVRGVYKITATDSSHNEYSSYFSILNRSIVLNISTYIDDFNDKRHMVFIEDQSSKIESVSGYVGDSSVSASTSSKTYIITFSTKYESISGTTVIFDENVDNVNASFKEVGVDCVETYNTYVFTPNESPVITLNNVPVRYIKNWKDYTSIEYPPESPDVVFSGSSYYVWDGINTAHISGSTRNYNFNEGLSDSEKLAYVSSMCSSVFGDGSMMLQNSSYNTNYVTLSLFPNYSNNEQYFLPYIYWDEEVTGSAIMRTSNTGFAQQQANVPHIVGSNYPVGYNNRTLLKKSANESFEADSYINNKTIKNNYCGVSDGIFGVNLFGVKHRQYDELDEPGKLKIDPQIPISGSTYGDYNISGATNFFGVRTVDKRFDYQFTFKTPLLLPSGYSSFNSLSKKSFIDGKVNFDLYGGFRLDFDSGSTLTSYSGGNDGPTSASTLYSTSIYEDSNMSTQVELDEVKENIWYNNRMDIDHVILSGDTNCIVGIDNITFSFVDCSTDFSDGIVIPGNREEIYLSYASGINVIRNSNEDYDIGYTVTNVTSTGFTEYFASFSGSSMTFKIAADKNWLGSTYTDVDTLNIHNDVYPKWSQRYQGDFPYNNRSKELAIYRCEPLTGGSFSVTSAYTVNFEVIPSDLPDPVYSGDTCIAAFYRDGDNVIPLTDEECPEYVKFTIHNSNTSGIENFGSNSFLIIPTRKVYTMDGYGTSLKQGVVYNMGYAYYAGSISVSVDTVSKHAIIRLNTPLRNDSDNTINYSSSSLQDDNAWHTIGNINNYYCDGAELEYISSRCEFDLLVTDGRDEAVMYFEIENGLKYRVNIDFKTINNNEIAS